MHGGEVIDTGMVSIGAGEAFLAEPAGAREYPGLLIVPAGPELDEEVQRGVEEFAEEGFVALATAPSTAGGLAAGLAFLEEQTNVEPARIGVVGLRSGSSEALRLAGGQAARVKAVATLSADLGAPGLLELVRAVRRPVLMVFGEDDPQSAEAIQTFASAAAGPELTTCLYPTTGFGGRLAAGSRTRRAAARDAFGKAVDFLETSLGS